MICGGFILPGSSQFTAFENFMHDSGFDFGHSFFGLQKRKEKNIGGKFEKYMMAALCVLICSLKSGFFFVILIISKYHKNAQNIQS